MADDVPMNPNQGFDNYAKEFQLRIELMRAAGEYAKATAEAMLTTAKALDQVERTKTIHAINRSLNTALRRIETAQREYGEEMGRVERHMRDINAMIAGGRPYVLNTLNARVGSIEWCLKHGGDVMAAFDPIPADARDVAAWGTISAQHGPEGVPAVVTNLAGLIGHMRARLAYPVPGGPAHLWLVGILTRLATAKAAVVAQLEKALADARAGQYGLMQGLLPFLKLEEE